MLKIDLSGVAPLRRAETRRRIQVIRDYLNIEKPGGLDRKNAAASLGLGTQQFTNLVTAWRLHGTAVAIAKAGANAGASRPPRKQGLPSSTRAAAEEALRSLPASASHKEAITAVRTLCELRGTRPPSDSMVSYLRLAVRHSGTAADGNPGLVIGRAIAALPTLDNGHMSLPELVIAVNSGDGSIISAAMIRQGKPSPKDFEKATNASVTTVTGPVTIGADDAVLAATLPKAKIVSRFAAGRLLAKALGRGVGGVRLSYGPLASTDPKRSLRAKADEPLDPRDTLETLREAMTAHNAARGMPSPWVTDTKPAS